MAGVLDWFFPTLGYQLSPGSPPCSSTFFSAAAAFRLPRSFRSPANPSTAGYTFSSFPRRVNTRHRRDGAIPERTDASQKICTRSFRFAYTASADEAPPPSPVPRNRRNHRPYRSPVTFAPGTPPEEMLATRIAGCAILSGAVRATTAANRHYQAKTLQFWRLLSASKTQ